MARPEGVEPPTAWFVARYSIQLSYGRLTKMSSIHHLLLTSTKCKLFTQQFNFHLANLPNLIG